MDALRRIPPRERADFEIADDGSYIHWLPADFHLDLGAIRSATDPEYRQKEAAAKAARSRRLGRGIESLRKASGLRRSDVPGISTRQLRRIEAGAVPRLATLQKLAKAHNMSLDDYLEALARQCHA